MMKTTKVTALKSFRHIYPNGMRKTVARGEQVEVADVHLAELERSGLVTTKMDEEHQNKMLGVPENKAERLPEINTQPAESAQIRTQGRVNATGDAPAGAAKVDSARETQPSTPKAPDTATGTTVDVRTHDQQIADAKKAAEKPKPAKPADKPAESK
jgi:hypothetical protein